MVRHRAQVWAAGEVVVARDAGREGCRGVVIQDQRLAGELREVDDHIGAFRRSDQQGVLVHVAHIKAGRVGDPGGGLLAIDDGRFGQETALVADLDPVWTGRAQVRVGGREDAPGRVCAAATSLAFSATSVPPMTSPRPFTSVLRWWIGHIPLQVEEAVVGRVQDAEAVSLAVPGSRLGKPCH